MADVKLELIRNSGYGWYELGGVSFKGYLMRNGKYLAGEKAAEYIKSAINADNDITGSLKDLNGVFAFVMVKGAQTLICVDRTRSFPLFYLERNEEIIVTDDTSEMKKYAAELNEEAIKPFLHAGYVPGSETLLKNVFQLQAGEFLTVSKSGIERNTYYRSADGKCGTAEADPEIRLKEILTGVGKDLSAALAGKIPVLPLSSGYDSRLIAALLKMNGFDKVLTFTYGRKDNPELKLSKMCAEKLGYSWRFIEYNGENLKNYLSSEDFRKYFPAASNHTSMFFLQEYFALEQLVKELPENAVFIPGHSGDSIAGSHITEKLFGTLDKKEFISHIISKHFIYRRSPAKITAGIADYIGKVLEDKNDFSHADYQNWIIKERHAKFIINSNRIYEHFGFQYLMPLADYRFMDLFDTVSPELKYGKKLYDSVLRKHFFEPLGLNFSGETNPSKADLKVQGVKNSVKKIVPKKIIDFYKEKVKINSDIYNNIGVTDRMADDMKKSGAEVDETGENRNSIIIQWYIHQLINNRF
jgi:asparagine synthase (glutamine-hydrolysing)